MQRFLSNYGSANGAVNGNDSVLSIMSNDFNWNELSIGNNDTLAENSFFGRKHPEHERKAIIQKSDLFHDAKENDTNESEENYSSSLDEGLHIGQPQQHRQNGRVPLCQHNQQVPNVYLHGELYKQRREIRMKVLEQKERDQRKFHAKPAPNFTVIHAVQAQKRVQEEPKVTVPITPRVVHSHRRYHDLVKAKQEKLIESQKPKPFVSKEPGVLKQPPFVPQLKKKTPTEPAPFNLHSDDRLRDRREFDKKVEEEIERKKREKEEQRKLEEELIRQQIRQQTTFKANPNPFSSGK